MNKTNAIPKITKEYVFTNARKFAERKACVK